MTTERLNYKSAGAKRKERQMFTLENTQGFSSDEIKMLNEAVRIVEDHAALDGHELEAQSIRDAINDAWHPGPKSADDLAKAARHTLGI